MIFSGYKFVGLSMLPVLLLSVSFAADTQGELPMLPQDIILTLAGESMVPTLHSGDQIRLLGEPVMGYRSGDLVALKFKSRQRMLLKRIIAVTGERVEWRDGRVFINDLPLLMDGWPADRRLPASAWKVLGTQLKRYNQRVPANSCIVMGDNSRKSYDSGDFGLVSMNHVQGLVVKMDEPIPTPDRGKHP